MYIYYNLYLQRYKNIYKQRISGGKADQLSRYIRCV